LFNIKVPKNFEDWAAMMKSTSTGFIMAAIIHTLFYWILNLSTSQLPFGNEDGQSTKAITKV